MYESFVQFLIFEFFLYSLSISNLRGFKSIYQNLILQSYIVSIATNTLRAYFLENAKAC